MPSQSDIYSTRTTISSFPNNNNNIIKSPIPPSPLCSTMPSPPRRRTRFVCISDTHNASPLDGCFRLPPGDVLIHAGDLTNQGTLAELRKTIAWIEQADYECKIVIAG